MCARARTILTGEHAVARVIARPFAGQRSNYIRTSRRHDFSLDPPEQTVLDIARMHGLSVKAVGKIKDIFNGRGITEFVHTSNNKEGQHDCQSNKVLKGLYLQTLSTLICYTGTGTMF